MRFSIDHGILSPSGHVSKRSRKAYLERARQELFGDGLPYPQIEQPTRKEVLLQRAAMWRELAARGVGPRKHIKAAEAAEREAASL